MTPTELTNETLWDWCFKRLRKRAWNLVRTEKKAWKFFVIWLIIFAIWLCCWFFDSFITLAIWIENTEFSLISSLASMILTIGLIGFVLKIVKENDAKIENFWKSITRDRIWKTLVWTLLIWIIYAAPIILFVLCSKIWNSTIQTILLILVMIILCYITIKVSFTQYIIVDKWLMPMESIKLSWKITKWHFWEIVGLGIVILFWNLIWLLCLAIGLIWTIPMTQLMMWKYYRSIVSQYEKDIK